MIEIDINNLKEIADLIDGLNSQAQTAERAASRSAMGPGYSVASGFDQMGTMHGLALKDSPGAAASVLHDLAHELSAIHTGITGTSDAFSGHDNHFAHVLEGVDNTSSGDAQHSYTLAPIAAITAAPLEKLPVGVSPGDSLHQLMLDLQATDGPAAYNSQRAWVDIINSTADISQGLAEMISQITATNAGTSIDALTTRLNDTAHRTETIATNASVINQALGQLDASRITKLGEVTAAKLEIDQLKSYGPSGIAAARIAEQLFLGYYAATTLAELTGLIPPVIALTNPDHATTGATIDSTINDTATGATYTTTGVTTPHALASDVADATTTYPDSFNRINAITQDMAHSAGATIGGGLFSPDAIRTNTATIATPGHFPPATTTTTGIHPTAMTPPPTTTVTTPITESTPFGVPSAPLSTPRTNTSIPTTSTPHTSNYTNPGTGIRPGTHTLTTNPDTDQPRRNNTTPTTPTTTPPNHTTTTTARRNNQVRCVTSRIEHDTNQRALLGERPPVIPDVISDWARNNPPHPKT